MEETHLYGYFKWQNKRNFTREDVDREALKENRISSNSSTK